MSAWPVCFVTAFGRGETLAMALQESGFTVQVLDFTEAFAADHEPGAGPFPVVTARFHPKQDLLLEDVRPLPRGLTFWLKDGPIELAGPMAQFFGEEKPFVRVLRQAGEGESFDEDWLRRFMTVWTSPFHAEPWEVPLGQPFPFSMEMGLLPANLESRRLSFERYRTLDFAYTSVNALHEVSAEGSRLTEILAEAGRKTAWRADQFVWCLSASETEALNAQVASRVFNKGVRRPEWRWLSFEAQCERGPWTEGFPEYSVLLGDTHLPWAYGNLLILRWVEPNSARVWLKAPATAENLPERRREWAAEAQALLNHRLPPAGFRVEAEPWTLCPHSLVFEADASHDRAPGWRNWDWIAPETASRLDLSARLEAEAVALARLQQWRADAMKKKGAAGDHALHAP